MLVYACIHGMTVCQLLNFNELRIHEYECAITQACPTKPHIDSEMRTSVTIKI